MAIIRYDDSMEGLSSRPHRRLALAYLIAPLLSLFIGLIAALIHTAELGLGPARDLISASSYQSLFSLHGFAAIWPLTYGTPLFVLGHLHADAIHRSERQASLWSGRLALVLWVTSSSLLFISIFDDELQPFSLSTLTHMSFAALWCTALSVLLALMRQWKASRTHHHTIITAGLSLTSLLVLVSVSFPLLSYDGDTLFDENALILPFLTASPLLTAAIVCSLFGADSDPRARRHAIIGLVSNLFTGASTSLWEPLQDEAPPLASLIDTAILTFVYANYLVAIVLGLCSANATTKVTRFWAAGAVLFHILVALITRYVDAVSESVELSATYVIVASFHAAVGFTLVLYFVQARRYFFSVISWSHTERLSLAVTYAGLLAFLGAAFHLGFEGMPRRYYAYLPQYQTGMHVMAAGGYAYVAGILLFFWDWARTTRRHRSRAR